MKNANIRRVWETVTLHFGGNKVYLPQYIQGFQGLVLPLLTKRILQLVLLAGQACLRKHLALWAENSQDKYEKKKKKKKETSVDQSD